MVEEGDMFGGVVDNFTAPDGEEKDVGQPC
jgi:hypothetical protein